MSNDENIKADDLGSITPEEMATAIGSSGYLLEVRIAHVLEENGFFVQSNIFSIMAGDSNKPIEVDVVGRRGELLNDKEQSTVTASILVECKNNTQPFAFFVQQQNIPELSDGRIQYGGFPSFSRDPETQVAIPLHRLLDMKDWHHYCRTPEIATQFCTFTRKGKHSWKAEPNESYTKSFSNLGLLAIHDWEGMFGLHLRNIQIQMTYPVVVFQGPIFRVTEESGSAKVQAVKHLQLQHFASSNQGLDAVQIDIVTEDEFPVLIQKIVGELRILRDRVKSQYERLLGSALDQKQAARKDALRRELGENNS